MGCGGLFTVGSRQSVRINNNSSYITGYSVNNKPTCGYTGTDEVCNYYCNDGSCNSSYNTSVGYLVSTTANISGIYDMSGGTIEYVMGVLTDSSSNFVSGRSEKYNSSFIGALSCYNCDGESDVLGGFSLY